MSSITRKLQKLLEIRKVKGFPVDDDFQPGLSRENIAVLTKPLPFSFPDEVYALYQWHNGIPDESEFYFLFRDHRFLPLEEALMEYQQIVRYYPSIGDEIDVGLCFPFAGFEGSYYCLPSETHPPIRGHKRPVISVFEGIDIHFYFACTCLIDSANNRSFTMKCRSEVKSWEKISRVASFWVELQRSASSYSGRAGLSSAGSVSPAI